MRRQPLERRPVRSASDGHGSAPCVRWRHGTGAHRKAVNHEDRATTRLLACPGCGRQLRVVVATEPRPLKCPECRLHFQVRCASPQDDDTIELLVNDCERSQNCPYEILGVSEQANDIEIKRAYRQAALNSHPDRNGNSPESVKRFREVANAYTQLMNTEQRAAYDAQQAARQEHQWQRVTARPETLSYKDELHHSKKWPTQARGPAPRAPLAKRPEILRIRYLVIGLSGGIAIGILMPNGSRLIQLLLGIMAFLGLARLIIRALRPTASKAQQSASQQGSQR